MFTKRVLTLAVAGLVGVSSISPPSGAVASTGCTVIRTYGFATITNDPAWASVVGHVQDHEISDGSHDYQLEVTARQAQYLDESIAGGCTPQVKYQTRGTTGALGRGDAFYDGTVTVSTGGGASESGVHPLPDCEHLTCQVSNVHHDDLSSTLSAGSTITVSGSATATAIAGGLTTGDQAHADWRVTFPVLRIPIP